MVEMPWQKSGRFAIKRLFFQTVSRRFALSKSGRLFET
ncbi:hypothetical protein l11_06460 [Neisseria weaveri LMG 5135]|nr:hypothetical protein l13_13270 [Neisseria weaveri ATCC 51223]EGV38322.1 hypothetical protein l11_06460 [Neisseria weaveri LMG 5135]